jgi:hypothetical protein
MSLIVFTLAAAISVVGGQKLNVRDVRKIQLTSTSEKVVAEVTGDVGCISIVQPKEPSDASLNIVCHVAPQQHTFNGASSDGGTIQTIFKVWECEGKLTSPSGGEIWKKRYSGETPEVVVSANAASGVQVEKDHPVSALARAVDSGYVQGSRKILAALVKVSCGK